MELVKKRKKVKEQWKISKWSGELWFPILGVLSVLLEKAFLFNPLILAIFHLSYRKSKRCYGYTFFSMLIPAFILHPSYGLEISLVGFVFFLFSFLFEKIEWKKEISQYYNLISICFLLGLIMGIKAWSFQTFFYCILATFLSLFLSHELYPILLYFDQEKIEIHDISFFAWLLFLFILSMLQPILGAFFLRFTFLLLPRKKKMLSLSLLGAYFFSLTEIYHYSIIWTFLLLLPAFFSSLLVENKKQRVILFLLFHFLFSVLLDASFYTNGIFYQGLVTTVLLSLLPSGTYDKIHSFFLNEEMEKEINKQNDLQKRVNIRYLLEYLSSLDFELGREEKTPLERAKAKVYREACASCEHVMYCSLIQEFPQLIKEKLQSEDRKKITKECIRPYKLTLSIQQAYAIFVHQESYFQESLRRKNALIQLIQNLKVPLKEIQKDESNFQKEKLYALLLSSSLQVKEIHEKRKGILFEMEQELIEEQEEKVKEILSCVYQESYACIEKRKELFSKSYFYFYSPIPYHSISYLTYSYAPNQEGKGDQFQIEQEGKDFHLLLCDGMGHDERAERTSKSLLHSFLALYHHEKRVAANLDSLNQLFRISLDGDNYSTLDFFNIDLQKLEMQNFKAGSASSFVIRDGKLFSLNAGGLPIGLLDEIDVQEKVYQLQIGDYLLILSDGIEEILRTELQSSTLELANKDEFFRTLFDTCVNKMTHFDDATMIVCKVL